MEGTYNLNELAMMTGFTTRTLRSYLNRGLLKGEKVNGAWQFTAEEVDRFFAEPFVKEGIRIKRSGTVFDFLADKHKKAPRACVILDVPSDFITGQKISAFFCERMKEASDMHFSFDWDRDCCRIILSGAEEQTARIMSAWSASELNTK